MLQFYFLSVAANFLAGATLSADWMSRQFPITGGNPARPLGPSGPDGHGTGVAPGGGRHAFRARGAAAVLR